jgi:hypothetical protein
MAQFRLRRAGAALAAIAAMAMGGGGLLSVVQAAAAAKPATADQVDDAKAQVKAAGIDCDVGNVRYVGVNTIKGAKGNVQAQTYEVTCANRFGYIIQGPKGGSADTTAYSCPGLKASADAKKKSAVQCELPENQNLTPMAQVLAQKAGIACTVQNSKWRGLTKSGAEFIELACAAGQPGYLMSVPKGADTPTAQNCLQLNGAQCELTTPAQSNAWLASIAAKSGRSCEVTKSRFVGVSKSDGSEYYEVGCAKGAGFMLDFDTHGALKRTIECADATALGGGCTLTDQATVQASALQTYGSKLKAIGVSCNVQKARLVGQTRNHEDVVEYACSDRPAGLVVAFPAPGGHADVVDCLDARHFGIQCEFTSRQAQMDLLGKAMTASGKSCAVSNFQNLGTTDAKTTVFELACGSAPGYIAEILPDYSKVRKADTCAEAAKTANKTGLSCNLPGNH